MAMVNMYYKLIVGGVPQYTHVQYPSDQPQDLPQLAQRLTSDAYHTELERMSSESRQHEIAEQVQGRVRRATEGERRERIVSELTSVGLSEDTARALAARGTGGVA